MKRKLLIVREVDCTDLDCGACQHLLTRRTGPRPFSCELFKTDLNHGFYDSGRYVAVNRCVTCVEREEEYLKVEEELCQS